MSMSLQGVDTVTHQAAKAQVLVLLSMLLEQSYVYVPHGWP